MSAPAAVSPLAALLAERCAVLGVPLARADGGTVQWIYPDPIVRQLDSAVLDPLVASASACCLAAVARVPIDDLGTIVCIRDDCEQGGGIYAAVVLGSRSAASPTPLVLPPDLLHERPERVAASLEWTYADQQSQAGQEIVVGQFGDRLSQAYEENQLLLRLARLLNTTDDPAKLLQGVSGQMREILPFSWLTVCFDGSEHVISALRGRRFASGDLPQPAERFWHYVDALERGKVADDWTRILTPDASVLAAMTGAEVLAEPIVANGRQVGVIVAGGKPADDADISSFETQFIDSAADFIGVFYQNVAAIEQQRTLFLGSMHALTAAIDAKDPYTRGHSERVSLLSRQLASAIGLDAATVETIRISGLLHDVGKIGVPEAVLLKPGRLTDPEFELLKRHPVIGAQILESIGPMAPMLPGVLHHHERWDGRGYPHRLAGEAIPLLGRVISFADAFDAMSSNRAYRNAMPRQKVLSEIRAGRGTQFDPSLVEPFLDLPLDEFDELYATAQAQMITPAA